MVRANLILRLQTKLALHHGCYPIDQLIIIHASNLLPRLSLNMSLRALYLELLTLSLRLLPLNLRLLFIITVEAHMRLHKKLDDILRGSRSEHYE